MRVKQLVVINFCDGFSNPANLDKPFQLLEDRQTAFGLYQKHVTRTEGGAPKAAVWIEVNNTEATAGAIMEADPLVPNTHYRIMLPANEVFAGVDPTDSDVGVYIIYHSKQSSDPNIFGVKSLDKAGKKSVQAERLVGLLTKLKIRPIRKLSLVGCHSDAGKTAASKNFLVAFGQAIAGWGKERPMIAGYDTYATGNLDGHKLAGENNTKLKATPHKHVWCYKTGILKDGWSEVKLIDSGWSDKHNLPTTTGTVAVIQ
ncbi:MAG: hypothetical protein ACKVQU_05340 [Burkholderiales bacterium]